MMKLLETNKIVLRSLEPEDLDFLYTLENNTDLWQVGNNIQPYSRFALKQHIANNSKTIYENGQLRLLIFEKIEKKPIGIIDLYDYEHFNNKAGIGIIIIKGYRRKGYASQAISLIHNYCFDFLKIKMLYAYVSQDNQSSFKLFKSLNYCESGLLKRWISTLDGYKDVYIFQKYVD